MQFPTSRCGDASRGVSIVVGRCLGTSSPPLTSHDPLRNWVIHSRTGRQFAGFGISLDRHSVLTPTIRTLEGIREDVQSLESEA